MTTKVSVSNIPNKKFSCPEPSGLFANSEDSGKYWHCSNYIPYEQNCPGELQFDEAMKICVFNRNFEFIRSEVKKSVDTNNDQFTCPEPNGFFKDTKNSKNFWHCSNNQAFPKNCPINLYFNDKLNICDYFEQTIERSS